MTLNGENNMPKLKLNNCGSKTLIKDENDAVCINCGYRIKNYKDKERFLGKDEFKKFENGILKSVIIKRRK